MPKLILSIHAGSHDASAAVFHDYELKAAVQLERLTRYKGDGRFFPDQSIDEVLSICGATRRDVNVVAASRSGFAVEYFNHFRWWRRPYEWYRTKTKGMHRRSLAREMLRAAARRAEDVLDVPRFLIDGQFRSDVHVHFYEHHKGHALPALFYTNWDDALLVTADAGGDGMNYSHRHFSKGQLTTIYGDESVPSFSSIDSLGRLYGAATDALGFRSSRHEGKVTGLAAMGQPAFYDEIAAQFWVDQTGRIHSKFRRFSDMWPFMRNIAAKGKREDVASSVQEVLEKCMLLSIKRLLSSHPTRRLGVAGGVFANVKLNRVLLEQLELEEIFVFPPMGDEGLPIGGALSYLLEMHGAGKWLAARRRLDHLYLGRDYGAEVDAVFRSNQSIVSSHEDPSRAAAERLAQGKIGAIFTKGMEFGPRALGGRSILASPQRRETHDILNSRLDRTEFMPFAPVTLARNADKVFDIHEGNRYAASFMTITCDTRAEWRARIPAVVHVDNSARPQVLFPSVNPLYEDILENFEQLTGVPVLVNTSFNVHEEPIVNTPAECLRALLEQRVDFVVTDQALYETRST